LPFDIGLPNCIGPARLIHRDCLLLTVIAGNPSSVAGKPVPSDNEPAAGANSGQDSPEPGRFNALSVTGRLKGRLNEKSD